MKILIIFVRTVIRVFFSVSFMDYSVAACTGVVVQ